MKDQNTQPDTQPDTHADIQREIHKIAKKLNVELCNRDPRKSYLWNGKNIGIKNLSFSNQLHELAHWQVASPEMRKEKDFGLGSGPESLFVVSRKMSYDKVSDEEAQASLLGIAYEAYLGLPFEKTLNEHNWFFDNIFWETVQKLHEKDLLEGHVPKIL